ncbi:MAG: hypothetical protein NC548_53370, partial [Lachnospiraceae bacterium]|nr:hypothetical protein [Lachnospiraceae bacterium]
TIRMIISVISQMVYAITIIVAIRQATQTTAAHFTWAGIAPLGVDTGSVALSNKSQSALKNKKPPKLKFIIAYFNCKVREFIQGKRMTYVCFTA